MLAVPLAQTLEHRHTLTFMCSRKSEIQSFRAPLTTHMYTAITECIEWHCYTVTFIINSIVWIVVLWVVLYGQHIWTHLWSQSLISRWNKLQIDALVQMLLQTFMVPKVWIVMMVIFSEKLQCYAEIRISTTDWMNRDVSSFPWGGFVITGNVFFI